MSDILQQIRDLQFIDKSGAEALLLSFIRDNFPLDVIELELTPLAVSLNSFNGFMTLANGTRRFFKTHTETDTVIDEYYNAGMLSDLGYPIIQPIFKSTEPGKQLLVYEVIEDESVFDVAWRIETENESDLSALTSAQNRADDELLKFYQQSLRAQSAETAEKSPVHQLFYHRLTGGRLDRFYGENTKISLPDKSWSMADVRQAKWVINGQEYDDTLNMLIQRAINLLNPAQADVGIIGHGDAHNGNVFFQKNANPASLLYFDPAFAGIHHPLLDLTKPLFHNVFAMWMYFPEEKRDLTTISLDIVDDIWHVRYNYDLPQVRHMFLDSKLSRTLIPIMQDLKSKNQLRDDWRQYLKVALFCCPFLTMDLTDSEKFSPEISLLGLAMSIEMGSESHNQRSIIDTALDKVEKAL
ncbi:MAG: hypothetical protein Phog2KO_16620 [Phototrophicaceae bacterium]